MFMKILMSTIQEIKSEQLIVFDDIIADISVKKNLYKWSHSYLLVKKKQKNSLVFITEPKKC